MLLQTTKKMADLANFADHTDTLITAMTKILRDRRARNLITQARGLRYLAETIDDLAQKYDIGVPREFELAGLSILIETRVNLKQLSKDAERLKYVDQQLFGNNAHKRFEADLIYNEGSKLRKTHHL